MAPDALASRVAQLEEELATVHAQVGVTNDSPLSVCNAPLVHPAHTSIDTRAQPFMCIAGRGGSN